MIYLETERLIIRDYVENDLYNQHKLFSDKIGMKYLPDLYISTIEEAKHELDMAIDEASKANRIKYFFAIILKEDHSFIGDAGYTVRQISNAGKVVNLGYFILKEHWGKGYTPEAVEKIIEFAFSKDNVIKIETGCLKENVRSEKIMLKCGMKKEGEIKRHQLYEGQLMDRLIYGLLKEEWARN